MISASGRGVPDSCGARPALNDLAYRWFADDDGYSEMLFWQRMSMLRGGYRSIAVDQIFRRSSVARLGKRWNSVRVVMLGVLR